jgi:hypothetical protein
MPDMKHSVAMMVLLAVLVPPAAAAQSVENLSRALAFHASFDKGLDADFSRGERACFVRTKQGLVPAAFNEELKHLPGDGRFGGGLHFTKKGATQPRYKGADVLGYNDKSWSATVSVWLRLDPDKDLEPGYCDPVQIVGDDSKKGFIFLEWSKDETPREFRFAIRPRIELWNPNGLDWAKMTDAQRPAVNLRRAPFSRERWTHAVFTLENLNDKANKPVGRLYLNGQLQGKIENWDLTLGWNPDAVQLVLGAAYVGHLDDLAVFNRAFSDAEVKQLFALKNGVRELHPRCRQQPVFMHSPPTSRRQFLTALGDGVNDPDRVALMGNFHPINVSRDESWVTVGEWQPRNGNKGDLLLARIRWNRPNALVT